MRSGRALDGEGQGVRGQPWGHGCPRAGRSLRRPALRAPRLGRQARTRGHSGPNRPRGGGGPRPERSRGIRRLAPPSLRGHPVLGAVPGPDPPVSGRIHDGGPTGASESEDRGLGRRTCPRPQPNRGRRPRATEAEGVGRRRHPVNTPLPFLPERIEVAAGEVGGHAEPVARQQAVRLRRSCGRPSSRRRQARPPAPPLPDLRVPRGPAAGGARGAEPPKLEHQNTTDGRRGGAPDGQKAEPHTRRSSGAQRRGTTVRLACSPSFLVGRIASVLFSFQPNLSFPKRLKVQAAESHSAVVTSNVVGPSCSSTSRTCRWIRVA